MTEDRDWKGSMDVEEEGPDDLDEAAERHALKMIQHRDLVFLVDSDLAIDRTHFGVKIRGSHLKRLKRHDPHGDKVLELLEPVREYLKEQIGLMIEEHPAYPWFSQIRGIGLENIGKVIGLIEAFGRTYYQCDNGHFWKPEEIKGKKKLRAICPTCRGPKTHEPFIRGIERLTSPSALYKHSGWGGGKNPKFCPEWQGLYFLLEVLCFIPFWPEPEFVIQRQQKGKLSSYNQELKTMIWRLGTSLQKARLRVCPHCSEELPNTIANPEFDKSKPANKTDNRKRISFDVCVCCHKDLDHDDQGREINPVYVGSYYNYYLRCLDYEVEKCRRNGIQILTSPGKMCVDCEEEFEDPKLKKCPECGGKLNSKASRQCPECGRIETKKDTMFCPVCNIKLLGMKESPGTIWGSHLSARAKRKMIKLFLGNLWEVWRKAEGLPAVSPFVELLGHKDIIKPEQMCDKPAKKKKRAA